jgi:serine/threonine protein kinase
MSIFTEVEYKRPATELGIRGERPFTAQDLVSSTGRVGRFTLDSDTLAATGSTGVVVAAHSPERSTFKLKVGFNTGLDALRFAKQESKLAAEAASVTDHVPAVFGTELIPLAITTQVEGKPHEVKGVFPVTVTEHVPGSSLAEKIDKEGGIGIVETVRILKPVAEALDAIHDAGLSHRDTTPGNVIDRPGSGGVLIDFDNAFKGTAVAEPALIGTPGYLAPEEFNFGEPVTSTADQWQLAATAYRAITGERLIPGENVIATMDTMLDPSKYSHIVTQKLDVLTPGVASVMARALESDPAERFLSASMFVGALEKAHNKDTNPSRLQKAATIFSRSNN